MTVQTRVYTPHEGHLEEDCPTCAPIAAEARRQREAFRTRRISANEWSVWRTGQFERGFGPAVADGERWAR